MNQKRLNQRPQKLDTQGVRGLVFALAISSTIGFWAMISKIDGVQSSEAEAPAQTSNEVPLVVEAGQTVVSLPPIPTLVPTLDPSIVAPLIAGAGMPAPSTIGAGIANPPLITSPASGKPSTRVEKEPVKPKKSRGGGGGNTTSTRSSK